MHLLIPFAGASSEPARQALATLELPNLARWLSRMSAAPVDDLAGDEDSFTPPHEHVLARHLGWSGEDGHLPLAAWLAQQDGVALRPDAEAGIGLMTPTHWAVGTDQITLLDPDLLQLGDAESRELLAAVQPLFGSEGWTLHWGAATRWYAQHPSLARLRTASLDRVIGRNVARWMPQDPQARRLRRLQSEVQMLLYHHPVNAAREARGALAVNSFWLSGCGAPPAGSSPADAGDLQVATQLRTPALASDWAAWCSAWREIDAQPMRALLAQAERRAAAVLTLCGERLARHYEAAPASWWHTLSAPLRRAPAVRAALETL
jgi:hypothetical protein